MALSAVKGTIDRVLDKNLQDLVRGIRNHKGDETKYINQCLDEIRNDLKQSSVSAKSNALARLIYLQMLGCDISWAVFNIVEIISSHRFTFKRVGYLAAAQSFHYDMDVLMLTTNQIHKDLSSMNSYDSAVALSGLSCFVNQDLAMNLYNEILMLTISSKPYLRKKSVLLLYKVFLHHPEALPVCFPRLKEKLEDPDSGVQCAAVNVICELARKNPRNYLSLAPVFFNMMTNSTNNWVLIKIIKLFGALTPLEPRLGKKLIEPLTNLIHSTSAMSLLYECINTIVAVFFSISSGVPDNHVAIQLCIQKLRVLIEDSDQNLKYLGLMAMGKILRHHAKSLQSHKDLVLACLHDKDESVRLRALSLLHGMVTKRSLVEIVQSMVGQIGQISASSHYCSELVAKVIHICAQENYHYITSFEWYISMLVELARMDGVRDGGPLADQLIEVAIRVPSVRGFCVDQMAILVDLWPSLVSAGANQSALHRVMEAAAWICGEYAQHLSDARHTLTGMFSAANRSSHLPGRIQAVLLLNAFKLYCSVAGQWAQQARGQAKFGIAAATGDGGTKLTGDRLLELTNHMVEQLAASTHSPDLEVQERAVSLHQLCSLVVKRLKKLQRAAADQPTVDISPKPSLDASGEPATAAVVAFKSTALLEDILALIDEFTGLFVGEINRVAPKAQRKVPVPAGLDLDAWIYSPPKKRSVDGLGEEMRLTAMLTPSPVVLLTADSPDQTRLNVSLRRDSNANTSATNFSGLFPELASTASSMPSQSELDEMRMKRLQEQQNNPHYLKPKNASVTVQGGDVWNKAQVEVATPANKGKADSLPAVTADSAVRECAKPEQFVKQIRQQFLQMDMQENSDKSTTKQSTRANRKSADRRKTTKKKAPEAQAEAAPSILVLADYDRPEGVSSGGTGDSSPERRVSLAHPLDDPLARNGLLPFDLGKSPSKAKGSLVVLTSDKHRKSADTSVHPPQRRPVGKTSIGARTEASGQRPRPEQGREEVCPPKSNDLNTTTLMPSGTETALRAGRDHKTVHIKSKGARNHHEQNRLDNQTISDKTPTSLHTTSDSVFAPAPMSPDQLVEQLTLQGQQSLSSCLSGKILWSGRSTAFPQLVSTLSDSVPCTVVERIGQQTASLYAVYGSQAAPVCCLLKHSPKGFVHYAIKSVTPEAAGACAARVKALLASTTFSG